jgi:hypothetical protein
VRSRTPRHERAPKTPLTPLRPPPTPPLPFSPSSATTFFSWKNRSRVARCWGVAKEKEESQAWSPKSPSSPSKQPSPKWDESPNSHYPVYSGASRIHVTCMNLSALSKKEVVVQTREPVEVKVGWCGVYRVPAPPPRAVSAPVESRVWHNVRLGSTEESSGRITWSVGSEEEYFLLKRDYVILPNSEYNKISIAPRTGGESLVLEFENADAAACNTWLSRLQREKNMCCASPRFTRVLAPWLPLHPSLSELNFLDLSPPTSSCSPSRSYGQGGSREGLLDSRSADPRFPSSAFFFA